MEKFTIQQVETKIRELAAANPDNTAECMYMKYEEFHKWEVEHATAPMCIVGTAVYELATDKTEAVSILVGAEGTGAVSLLRKLDVPVDYYSRSAKWITDVQGWQDSGLSWENAVKGADFAYPEGEDL